MWNCIAADFAASKHDVMIVMIFHHYIMNDQLDVIQSKLVCITDSDHQLPQLWQGCTCTCVHLDGPGMCH